MGARIKEASEDALPPKFRYAPCPTCGQKTSTVNGQWLREKRLRAGLTQRAFGRLASPARPLSGPYISDLETNRRECPPSILRAYARLRREP